MTKIEEIYADLLPLLEKNGLEDTPLHRLWLLQGLRAAWTEDATVLDADTAFSKSLYIMTVDIEMSMLKFHLIRQGYTQADFDEE